MVHDYVILQHGRISGIIARPPQVIAVKSLRHVPLRYPSVRKQSRYFKYFYFLIFLVHFPFFLLLMHRFHHQVAFPCPGVNAEYPASL